MICVKLSASVLRPRLEWLWKYLLMVFILELYKTLLILRPLESSPGVAT